jgi:hypothetical protein
MRTKSGLKAEKSINKFSIGNVLVKKAFAEETPIEPSKGDNTEGESGINVEELIARVRKEEKDKLYPRISKLEEDNKKLTGNINDYLLSIGAKDKKIDELNDTIKNLEGSKVTDKDVQELKEQVETLTAENKTLKENAPNEEDIRKSVEEEFEKKYEVKQYLAKVLEENKGNILTAFIDTVSGETKEEIDESVKKAVEKSKSIKEELGIKDESSNSETDETNKDEKSEPPKTPPISNPEEKVLDNKEFTAEYIQKLDPKSEEYATFRKKAGLK